MLVSFFFNEKVLLCLAVFFNYLLLAQLALCCCPRAFRGCREWALLSCGARASHTAGFSCGLRAPGVRFSGHGTHGLSCPKACGVLQELNLCLPLWRVGSSPLGPREVPLPYFQNPVKDTEMYASVSFT